MSFYKDGNPSQYANQGALSYNAGQWSGTQQATQPQRSGGFDGNPQYQQFSAPVQTQQLPQQQHTVYLPQMSPQMAHQLQQLQQSNPAAYNQYLVQVRQQQMLAHQRQLQQQQLRQQQQQQYAGVQQGHHSQGGFQGSLNQLAMRQQVYPQALSNGNYRSHLSQQQPQALTRTTPTPSRARKKYQDESDGDEEDEEDAYQTARGVAAQASRPRRAAAQQAAQHIKSKYVHDDDEDEEVEEQRPADDADQYRRMALGVRTKPKPVNHSAEKASAPTRPHNSVSHRRSSYAEDEEAASGSEADEDARRAAVAAKNAAIAAMLEPAQLAELDDEVERIISHRPAEDAEEVEGDKWASMEFWVKWKRWSYRHCSWDTLNTLSQLGGYKRVLNYCKRQEEMERARQSLSREEQELFDVERQMEEQLVQEHMELERVVSVRKEGEGKVGYLCKWRGLPYVEATWEPVEVIQEAKASDKVDAYQERQYRLLERGSNVDVARHQMYAMRSLQEQPEWLKAGKLRDYQLDGLNWLVYSWAKGNNCILADEMGLGKTVQCVAMVGFLSMQMKVMGPFLVVVPLSTVPNWIKEFNKWLPQANTVVYVGDSKSREVIRMYEFTNQNANQAGRPYKFEVLITTYELVLKDADILGTINWSYLIVDEAHRLKNNDSALYQELSQWNFRNKLLVTGTPLQNSIKELWALLHFLEPHKFPSCSHFEETHSLTDAEGVTQLHAELKPHLLRRVIKDVERSLPPKKECILRVEMTPLQKQYYKYILSRNYRELNKGSGPQISLLNIIIELKKCCNHPFLFSTAEEEFRGDEKDLNAVDRLVRTSGKMVLLDKLMRSLKQNGHRVLIFSQMVRALDIISDYMRLRGYQHQRLDGSTPAATRHQAMEHFNAPGSQDFAFLLSTRAGGLGINLATADTVIIFDSDWNPQNDLQAMSRAHRIGQTETVNIYRFLTSGSVEEDILQRAKQKMVLDHLVIQRMDTSGRTVLDASGANTAKKMFGKDELAAILRFGAEELFKEDEHKREQKQDQMLNEDLESILARAEVVHDGEQPTDGSELLNSFNVATFKADEDDAAFWNRLIPVTERPKDEPAAAFEDLGMRSTRYRAVDDYNGRDDTPGSGAESDSGSEGGRRRRGAAVIGRKRGRAAGRGSVAGPPVDGALARVDVWPQDCDIHGTPLGKGRSITRRISKKDAGAFLKAVKRYGRVERMADIAQEVGSVLQDQPATARYALWWGLIWGCEKVERLAGEKKADVKDALLDWFGVGIKTQEITAFVKRMDLLSQRIQAAKDPERHYRLDDINLSMPKWGNACGWDPDDDQKLLLGCYWYGIGRWDEMARDERLRLGAKLAVAAVEKGRSKDATVDADQKHLPKGSHIETRAVALLRKLQTVHEKSQSERSKPVRLSGRKRGAAAMTAHFPDDAADRPELLLGEDIMINVKKLRVLQRKGDEMERQKVVEKTRKYLASVGDRIRAVATQERTRQRMWEYVSKFTENSMDGEKLERVYHKIKSGKASAATVHSTGAGTHANGLEETEDGDLVDEEAYEEEEEELPPESSKRHRAEDWEGGRATPPTRHSQRSRSARESMERSWEEDESKWDGSQQDDLKEDLRDEDDIDEDIKPEAAGPDALDLRAEADQDGYREASDTTVKHEGVQAADAQDV